MTRQFVCYYIAGVTFGYSASINHHLWILFHHTIILNRHFLITNQRQQTIDTRSGNLRFFFESKTP